MVGVNDPYNAETGELNQPLVGIPQAVANGGPYSTYHREMLSRDVTAAIRGSLKGCPLDGNREKVEVVQEGSKAALSDNRAWELF